MRTACALGFALLAWAPLSAQTGEFQRPVTGFVHRPASRTIRPVAGLPGASSLGAPVIDNLDSASISPAGTWAIAARDGAAIAIRGLDGNSPAPFAVDGMLDSVDRIAWSSDGAWAVLWSGSRGQLQRLRFASGSAAASAPLDFPAPGAVTALAIARSGRIALGVSGAGFYSLDGNDSPALSASTAEPAAAAFDDRGRLYAVDAAASRIFEFDPSSGPAAFAALDQPAAASDFPGIAVSAAGRCLMVADARARAVRVYDIASRTLLNMISLDFAPARLERLSTEPVFLLNGGAPGEWLLVLDARQTPSVYFVPAGQEDAQ